MTTVEWKPAKLDQLGFVGRGKSRHRPRNAAILYGGPYPFFQTGDIKAANFHLTEYSQTYSEEGLAQSKLWKPGTLCITIAANIAESAILGIEGCFPDSVVGFIADPDKTDVRFIKYYMEILKLQMQSASRGTTQDNLSVDKLLTFDFLVPPLPMQQRIAGILSAYDELIENSQRRIRILETMARDLYREWFVHFRFPGHENHPRIASSLGEIPQGWEVKKLNEICSKLIDGTHDSPTPVETGYPLITGRHIKGGFIDFSDAYLISPEEHQKVMKRSRPERGDIIYSNIGTLGATAIVDQDFEYSIKNVALLKPISQFYSLFLYCYLESPANLCELTQKASGTSQKFFSLQFLRTIELIVPSNGILELFTKRLTPILTARSTLNRKIQNLRQTRDLLLPRLLSGQISLNGKES